MSQQSALVSYDVKPSPRGEHEFDVKTYIEALQNALKNA